MLEVRETILQLLDLQKQLSSVKAPVRERKLIVGHDPYKVCDFDDGLVVQHGLLVQVQLPGEWSSITRKQRYGQCGKNNTLLPKWPIQWISRIVQWFRNENDPIVSRLFLQRWAGLAVF